MPQAHHDHVLQQFLRLRYCKSVEITVHPLSRQNIRVTSMQNDDHTLHTLQRHTTHTLHTHTHTTHTTTTHTLHTHTTHYTHYYYYYTHTHYTHTTHTTHTHTRTHAHKPPSLLLGCPSVSSSLLSFQPESSGDGNFLLICSTSFSPISTSERLLLMLPEDEN